MMAEAEVRLTPAQRAAVELTIRKHCHIRNWILHAVNVRSNHVHVVVTCACEGEKAMDELKLWGSRCLSDLAGLTTPVARKAGRRHWWTEGGDNNTIDETGYLENAVEYVKPARRLRPASPCLALRTRDRLVHMNEPRALVEHFFASRGHTS